MHVDASRLDAWDDSHIVVFTHTVTTLELCLVRV